MMKKIIALALALSMALSMVAFAGYTDADKINADLSADVELVKALGIMTGNPDGSFNPLGTLTRGEAAVIIYRLKANRSDIDASWGHASLNGFTDMAGHWSAPYVNYCAALGLITGDPAGTFRPNDAVTAVEMAKMLLNVAGYDTEKQGYKKNWPMAVLADATNAGLFAEYEAAYTGAASREWVAKLVANLLNVQTVGYSQLTGTLVGNVNDNGAIKFGAQYGYVLKTGTVIATAKEALGADGTVAGTGKTVVKIAGSDYTLKTALAADMIGSKVNVYFKATPVAGGTENKVYAVIEANKKVIETTMDQIVIDEDANDETKYVLTVGGEVVFNDTKSELTMTQYKNLVSGSYYTFDDEALNDARPVTVIVNGNADATTVDFYFNNIEYAKKVSKHTADEFAFKAGSLDVSTEADYEKLNFVDTVAKNNYVAIEKVGNKNVSYNISKMTVLRSKLSSVVGGKKIVVAGTTYEPSYGYKSTFESAVASLTATNLAEKTYNIYTDGKYVVSFGEYTPSTTTSGVNTNVAYVIDSYKAPANTAFTSDSDKVQVLLTDGSIAIYEYAVPETATTKVAMPANPDSTNFEGKIYDLILNDDGTVYFKQLASEGDTTTGTIVDDSTNTVTLSTKTLGQSYMSVGGTAAYLTEDTFFFVDLADNEGKHTYSVIKATELFGKNLTGYSFNGTAAYVKNSSTGLNSLVYGVMAKTFGADQDVVLPGYASTAGDYFITTGAASSTVTADGATYTVAGINANGEKETLTLADNTGVVANKVYKIETVGEKVYLKSVDADVLNNLNTGWNKTLITGILDGAIMLTDTNAATATQGVTGTPYLKELAEDVVVTYIYKNSSNKVTLKTADLPETIKFTALNDGIEKVTWNGKSYNVYETDANGWKIFNDGVEGNAKWRLAEPLGGKAIGAECVTQTYTAGTDVSLVAEDVNLYSYVYLNAEGVVTDIIIRVEGKDSNDQVDISDLLSFYYVAPVQQ